jgi:hypothetical protein
MVPPGIEIGFAFSEDSSQPMDFDPIVVTVMPNLATDTVPRPGGEVVLSPDLVCSIRNGPLFPVELIWNDVPAADYYRVVRDGKPLLETAAAFLPDGPPGASGEFSVEAMRDGKAIARSQPIRYTAPPRTEEHFDLKLETRPTCVLLRWPPVRSPLVTSYRIRRAPAAADAKAPVDLARKPASRSSEQTFRDTAPAGDWQYTVTAVDIFGHEGLPATARIEFKPGAVDLKPTIDLPLNEKPAGCSAVGDVDFGPSGATFKGGYLTLPHGKAMDLGDGMTLTFEFKADSTRDMPVLLSHGLWQADGWFAQILGGALIIRTPAGDAQGPPIEPGKWYSVRFVFDGEMLHLAVNGREMEPATISARPIPAHRSLVIGQYDRQEPTFAFKGAIRGVKIYAGVFTR